MCGLVLMLYHVWEFFFCKYLFMTKVLCMCDLLETVCDTFITQHHFGHSALIVFCHSDVHLNHAQFSK